MSVNRSVQFYCGNHIVEKEALFGGSFLDYEFSIDIECSKDLTFGQVAKMLRDYMFNHDIRTGYCDITFDLGGGYSLFKRYRYYNHYGKIVTKEKRYSI